MTSINHHPKVETLADFAAGRLDEARAVVVATHLAMCEECAQAVAEFEAVGGALLDDIAPVQMKDDALESALARIGPAASVMAPVRADSSKPEHHLPISAYLDRPIDEISWKRVAPGLAQAVVDAQGYRPGVLRLLKIDPGTKMPKHTHGGEELTLILRGAYRDEVGEFTVGDLADLDGDHTHTPEATGDEPCICLIATAAPLRFKSLIGRLAQPFIRL